MNPRLSGPGAWVLYFITAMLMVFILAPLAVVIAMSVSDSYFVSFPPQGFTLALQFACALHLRLPLYR